MILSSLCHVILLLALPLSSSLTALKTMKLLPVSSMMASSRHARRTLVSLYSPNMIVAFSFSPRSRRNFLPDSHQRRRLYDTCSSSGRASHSATGPFTPTRLRDRASLYSTLDPCALGTNENDAFRSLLDPYEILRDLQQRQSDKSNPAKTNKSRPIIPLPTHLSPTSLELFRNCAQAFFFVEILKLSPDPPTTPALARGILCHTALEEVFDLRPADRSLTNLENLFRRAWKRKRGAREGKGVHNTNINELDDIEDSQKNGDKGNVYDSLFRNSHGHSSTYDIEAEVEWGKHSLKLLENYYELEDPRSLSPPNPVMREMWVHARFGTEDQSDDLSFVVRGVIDRIDMFVDPKTGKALLQIIDYKTGKKPHFKYSPPVNQRIENEQFFKMRVYALVLWKMILQTERNVYQYSNLSNENGDDRTKINQQFKYCLPWELQQKVLRALGRNDEANHVQWSSILEILSLRLFFLTSHLEDESANDPSDMESELGRAAFLDIELQPNLPDILRETEQEVLTIGREIKQLVDMQDPMAFRHCDKKFCNCHEMRRRFRHGSVWSSD
ncbi:hypothetical protein ACHAWX_005687 [Stephanocyclus meneghinianus]